MPARHDILCGSLDFLWRPWGSIEVWEEPITQRLRRAGVTTMLVSDHPHLFEVGGENYHTDFSGWEYVRGHEGDPWRTYADPTFVGTPALPARGGGWFWRDRLGWADAEDRAYDRSRTFFRAEEDFPGPRTMRTAARWLRDGAPDDAPFLLFVDEFDPHEPFDTPEPWAGRYDPDWDGELLIWPPYDIGAVAAGRLSDREGRQIRANYGAKLSMIDHWVGRIFDALTERGLWETTAVIVCTDHGHYLGEKDIWGKPGVMQYEPLGHIPLLVSWPGAPGGGECAALTTNVDINATLVDVFGVPAASGRARRIARTTRCAAKPLTVREWAIGGVYGNWVQVTDGRRKYARGAAGTELPALHVVQPLVHHARARPGRPGPAAHRPTAGPASTSCRDRTSPSSASPSSRATAVPFWVGNNAVDAHFLFDLGNDPQENENLRGTAVEADMVELLRVALRVGRGARVSNSCGWASRERPRRSARMTAATTPFVLPRIPASAGALIFDGRGRLLIANPTYKEHWTIPGGIMEADGETPWEACQREVREEVGLVSRTAAWSPSTSCDRSRRSQAACGSSLIAACSLMPCWTDLVAGGGTLRIPSGRADEGL